MSEPSHAIIMRFFVSFILYIYIYIYIYYWLEMLLLLPKPLLPTTLLLLKLLIAIIRPKIYSERKEAII